mmetsp:Transcript_92089/g.166289  ORF Transcript_92089/g.166289 Transcript_92089/m.166289 type:complete len:119 (+) Transcript_92089:15-371(+)
MFQTDRIDHTSKLCTSFKGCAKLVVQTAVWQERSALAACVPFPELIAGLSRMSLTCVPFPMAIAAHAGKFGIKQLEVRIKHEHRCQAKIIVMVNRWGSLGSLGFLLCDKQLWSLELEP